MLLIIQVHMCLFEPCSTAYTYLKDKCNLQDHMPVPTFLDIHYTMYTKNERTKQGGSLILAICNEIQISC